MIRTDMTHTGYLQVEVGKRLNKSVITNSYFDGVLKITRPAYLSEDLPLLTLIHVGGGYVDGDSYLTEVTVSESATLALTTQASTKVYKSPRFGACQTADYFLKEDSSLYVKQDPLILYKDASFTQSTHVYMTSSSTFYYTDIVTPGWSKDGQLFQYKKVTSKMKIFVDGRLAVFDHLHLNPDDRLEPFMYLEGFTHVGTMYFIHQKVDAHLVEDLSIKLSNLSEQARVGVSLLGVKGLSIRILAVSTTVIESIFTEVESYISDLYVHQEKIAWRK